MASRPSRRRRFPRWLGGTVAVVVLFGLVAQCGRGEEETPAALSAAPATTTARAVQPVLAAPPATTTPPPTTTRPPRTTTAAPTTTAQPRSNPEPRPNPQPAPQPNPQPAPETEEDEPEPDVYYANCDAVRAAGAAPIRRGDPGYRSGLDRDGDGQGCGSD